MTIISFLTIGVGHWNGVGWRDIRWEDRGSGKELRERRMLEKGSGKRVGNGGEVGKKE